jgi:hypothetical protein
VLTHDRHSLARPHTHVPTSLPGIVPGGRRPSSMEAMMLTPDLEHRSASTCHSPYTNGVLAVAESISVQAGTGGGL